jgi:hypothetical protein
VIFGGLYGAFLLNAQKLSLLSKPDGTPEMNLSLRAVREAASERATIVVQLATPLKLQRSRESRDGLPGDRSASLTRPGGFATAVGQLSDRGRERDDSAGRQSVASVLLPATAYPRGQGAGGKFLTKLCHGARRL